MTTATLTEPDIRIRDAVLRQLEWDPEVDASAIGVAAVHGTVTLTGFVDTYAGKLAAERAAKKVHGVRAVANLIDVQLRIERTDAEIALDVTRALELRHSIPEGVQAVVHHGHVTLTGNVNRLFQKEFAEEAVRPIRGVRSVTNRVVVTPVAAERDIRRRIVRALHQNADVDGRHISVGVAGNVVTLTGSVGTWLQREAAEQAAAIAPGVALVDNRLAIQSFHDSKHDGWDEEC